MTVYKKLGITGNRPHKLAPGTTQLVRKRLEVAIHDFARKGGEELLQGCALGVDQWAATEGFRNGLRVQSLVPFKGQESKWSQEERLKYHDLLYMSDTVEYFGDYPAVKFFFVRNKAIVDRCDILLAVRNVEKTDGGAVATMKYALKVGRPVIEVIVHSDRIENKFHPPKKQLL